MLDAPSRHGAQPTRVKSRGQASRRELNTPTRVKPLKAPGVLPRYRLSGPLVAIGDVHYPFHSPRWQHWVVKKIKELQPAYIVQVGDLYDDYAFSRFARSLNYMTPRQETTMGLRQATEFWEQITDVAPKQARKIQMKGNHDGERLYKRVLESLPEAEHMIDWDARHRFPGVETVSDPKQELRLGLIYVQHGHKKHGEHAVYNQAPTVVGHLHRGGLIYYQNRLFNPYWELNVGYGADPTKPCFNYRYQKDLHKWTQGLGIVDEDGPRFAIFPG